MSGHSHWSSIKHKKGAEDKKRGQIFSKLSRIISVAAKNGGDPDMNPTLRMAIEQAKKANMPNENIEKAIKRGTGELEGEALEEFCFEAYGPAKSALIITGITNNKNRALNEVKQILNQNNAKLAEGGSVKWQFKKLGLIIVSADDKEKEEIEMTAIEAGAEDTNWRENLLEVYVEPEKVEKTKKAMEEKGLSIESVTLGWVPKEEVQVSDKEKQAIEKLFSALDDNDDVQEVYSNVKV